MFLLSALSKELLKKNIVHILFYLVGVVFNTLYLKNHLTEIKKKGNDVCLWNQYVYQISSQSEMVGEV
jgi:hypothetical protein